MTGAEPTKTFNLTPSPRVLRMLGQIDFKPWQCLAELIDNAVDAFLSARDEKRSSMYPQVNVELSAAADIRRKMGSLTVSDNGPGMSPEDLEGALRAGYSTNNPVDKLGLFGMGFNVATARLGNRTEVWTTRLEDDNWTGIRIDFDEMEKAGSFEVPVMSRRKTAAEADTHGTEIVVTKLDEQRALYLRSGGGLKATREKLSRVYNKIMRDIGLNVVLVDSPLVSREFCVWGRNRAVDTKSDFGRVPAYIEINQNLGERQYCDDCWVWLLPEESVCPVCGSEARLRNRTRQVSGWIGIQRFFDQQDYGIDLIRNGRVIEERSKSFFSWSNPDTGELLAEYPLEQTHWGGRIVGELNVDFVPLASHQKDSFDKNTPEWKLVQGVVRGEGPIIQVYRQRLGYPDREPSPFARLHQAYRRGQPAGLRWLVPGDAQGRGINKEPQTWAAEFWAGNPDYKTDDRWWAAVVAVEEARTKKKGVDVPAELDGEDDFPRADDEPEPETDADPGSAKPLEPTTDEDAILTGSFELPEIPGAPRLDVEVRRLRAGQLPSDLHFEFLTIGTRAEATYNPAHPVFVRSLIEPVDCLVEELAYQFLTRSTSNQREWPLSRITWGIRQKYFPWSIDSYEVVYQGAVALLQDLLGHYSDRLAELAPIDSGLLTPELADQVRRQVALLDRGGEDRVAEVIRTGEFPRYLGNSSAEYLVRTWPEVALDGEFLSVSYSDVDARLRRDVIDRVANPLRDVMWVANPDGPQTGGQEWRTLVGRAANGLRLIEGWRS